jgi:aldose 1-epimerase
MNPRSEKEHKISEFILKNSNGISVKILSYGGVIQQINFPDKNGFNENVVLNYKNPKDYLKDEFFIGSLIGRYANRISHSSFVLNDEIYNLSKNEGENHLHGGEKGFHNVNWSFDEENSNHNSITLRHFSQNHENGYPGNLNVSVKYSLLNTNILDIEFYARSDMDTVFNPTSHSYFNLNPKNKTIVNHRLKINSKKFLDVDKGFIPKGNFKNVDSTPFDFRKEKEIGVDLNKNDKQLNIAKGYDHCFVLNKDQKIAAELSELETGRLIQIYTDQPGIQLYTGNHLKKGFLKNQGICLETQHFPDSPNINSFPSTTIKANTDYYSKTSYHFKLL